MIEVVSPPKPFPSDSLMYYLIRDRILLGIFPENAVKNMNMEGLRMKLKAEIFSAIRDIILFMEQRHFSFPSLVSAHGEFVFFFQNELIRRLGISSIHERSIMPALYQDLRLVAKSGMIMSAKNVLATGNASGQYDEDGKEYIICSRFLHNIAAVGMKWTTR